MQISKNQFLRLGIAGAAVLLVGWGMWQCQSHLCLLDSQMFYPSDYVDTSEYGWPMFHTHEIKSGDTFVPASARYERSALFPGMLVNASVWCLVLIGTVCVVWRWTGHGRQWRLRTLFGVVLVVAILLGWWRWERDVAAKVVPLKYIEFCLVYSDSPMLTLLHSAWQVYVPVFFGLGCGIYWVGWIGSSAAVKIVRGTRYVAMSKLRSTN